MAIGQVICCALGSTCTSEAVVDAEYAEVAAQKAFDDVVIVVIHTFPAKRCQMHVVAYCMLRITAVIPHLRIAAGCTLLPSHL